MTQPNLHNRGSALIITLSILVLVAGIVLAFFTRSAMTRQIAFFSTGQYRANSVARTALDTITGDLRSEIVVGSTPFALSSGSTLYLPAASGCLRPSRVNSQDFVNLVKQSTSAAPFWSGTSYTGGTAPIRAAVNNSTLSPAANQRYIKLNRWNKSGLLGDPGTGGTPVFSGTTPSGAAYSAPDWIVVTREGAIADATSMPSMAVLSDKSGTNGKYAVGRFAYAIFDESGLLDANVAGMPSALASGTFAKQRGLLAQVDLGNLPGVADPNTLVQWRNRTTAASGTAYSQAVFSSTSGFITVNSGDQAFVTRKDLINYIQSHPAVVSSSALPCLGTFTRDLDGPSYAPAAAVTSATNPNLLKIRVTQSFPRADGTQAVVGEPLLKHRFPLSRLTLFQDPVTNAAKLQSFFAMQTGSNGMWEYVDPDTLAVSGTLPHIKTLDEVAAAGREPTFWELLQAGILAGSLGTNNGATVTAHSVAQDSSKTRQILSIGLSIIDQSKSAAASSSAAAPTVLRLGGITPANPTDLFVAGAQNAPYIFWIAHEHFQDTYTSLSGGANAYVDGYLLFALWNPHRNASSGENFRIRGNGKTHITVQNKDITSGVYRGTLSSAVITHNNTVLAFNTTASRNFSQMSGLLPSDAVLTGGSTTDVAKFPYPLGGNPVAEVGLLMGQVSMPKTPGIYASGTANATLNFVYDTPLTITVEKLVGGNWIPYQVLPNYNANNTNNGIFFTDLTTQLNKVGGFTYNASTTRQAALLAYGHSDPRTNRLGMLLNQSGNAERMIINNFNIIDTTTHKGFGFTASSGAVTLADYAYNTTTGSSYADTDGTTRKGDANPDNAAIHSTYSPYAGVDARPILLGRPFTSVAEMGYAFRDDPWRTLDFASQFSADSGLLDLFCLTENDNALRAGVLNLNSASKAVLTAILMNAYRDPASSDLTPLSETDAANIAQAVVDTLGPPKSPTFVIQSAADLPLLADKIATSLPDRFKFKREAFTRAFADIANGRTWNLMVDVIAQAGRYRRNSASLNDFVIEGEQRYWLHLAIDRATGVVVAKSLEQVTE